MQSAEHELLVQRLHERRYLREVSGVAARINQQVAKHAVVFIVGLMPIHGLGRQLAGIFKPVPRTSLAAPTQQFLRAGASQAISSGPRDRARAWAREIFTAYPDVDGLWYRSSMDAGAPAVCLWERSANALPAQPWVHLPLSSAALALPVARACRQLGYRFV